MTITSLKRMSNKAERICRKVLDSAERFPDEPDLGCQQESRLKTLKVALERFAELA
jgi:hypothetical protein